MCLPRTSLPCSMPHTNSEGMAMVLGKRHDDREL
jgi:hypothetical protein